MSGNMSNVSSSFCSVAGYITRSRTPSFDRHADRVPPLRPAAVVVADVVEPEEILERKPGVAAAFADPAVRDRFLLRGELLRFAVQLLQLHRGLERAIVRVHRPPPGNALRAGDV